MNSLTLPVKPKIVLQRANKKIFKLHHYCEENDVSNKPWAINGSGFHHIVGLMDELYRSDMSMKEGAALAVYLLKVAKMRGSGVGGPTEILMVAHNGETSMLNHSCVEKLENDFWNLHKIFQSAIEAVVADQTKTETVGIEEIYELLD